MSRHLLAGACTLAVLLPAATFAQDAPQLTESWRAAGFANPESVFADLANNRIIVSNIAGFGPDTGADGFLSVIDLTGTMVTEKWAEGLTDPKGIGSDGTYLYVGDAPGIQVVDPATGALVKTITLEGAAVLNDVTADDAGTIYVTDTGNGGVAKVADGEASWLVAPGTLSRPNGIFWDNGTLYVGTFGETNPEKPDERLPGGLYTLDPATGAVTAVEATNGTAMVDGIARIGDYLLYNDNPSGTVFAVDAAGALVNLGAQQEGAADHGTAGETLVVPYMRAGEIVGYSLQ